MLFHENVDESSEKVLKVGGGEWKVFVRLNRGSEVSQQCYAAIVSREWAERKQDDELSI
jgi:hypothetical protein